MCGSYDEVGFCSPVGWLDRLNADLLAWDQKDNAPAATVAAEDGMKTCSHDQFMLLNFLSFIPSLFADFHGILNGNGPIRDLEFLLSLCLGI